MELEAKKIQMPVTDINAFFDHHQARGWMLGSRKMSDWKAAMRTWNRNRGKFQTNGHNKPEELSLCEKELHKMYRQYGI